MSERWSEWRRWGGSSFAFVAVVLLGNAAAAQHEPSIKSPEAFVTCTESWPTDMCLDALRKYVKANPGKAFDAGKAVTYGTTHWVAMPFFDAAFAGASKNASCSDERLHLAVSSSLALPRGEDNDAVLDAATKLLSGKCWEALREPISKRLNDGFGYLRQNVCPILAAKKVAPAACAQREAPRPKAPAWEALDPKTLEVEATASVYRGEKTQRVTLVKVKGKDYFLVKFEGFAGPWNGKVVLHREERLGDRGNNYWTRVGAARHVSVVMRSGWGAESYEVYPRGAKGPFHVSYDEKLSQAARPKALLAELAQ
ncbi:MAG TPA: hypothetical protein VMG12_03165 [Polyangiaceae bacterium]|nr:hypothetical protein [Polyangiaceae bacterium]